MAHDLYGVGEGELTTFVTKLGQFRDTLAPSEQRLLDELLLAVDETGDVDGYALQHLLGKRTARAALLAFGLGVSAVATPLASPASSAEASTQAQPTANTGGPMAGRSAGPSTSTTSTAPSMPTTPASRGGPASSGPMGMTTPAGPSVGPMGMTTPAGPSVGPITRGHTPEVYTGMGLPSPAGPGMGPMGQPPPLPPGNTPYSAVDLVESIVHIDRALLPGAIRDKEEDIRAAESRIRSHESRIAVLFQARQDGQPPSDEERLLRDDVRSLQGTIDQIRAEIELMRRIVR